MEVRSRFGDKFESKQIRNPVESDEWAKREYQRELQRNECASSEEGK